MKKAVKRQKIVKNQKLVKKLKVVGKPNIKLTTPKKFFRVSNTLLIIVLLIVIVLGLVSLGLYWKLSSEESAFSELVLNSAQKEVSVQQSVPLNTQGQASINVLPSPKPSPEEN